MRLNVWKSVENLKMKRELNSINSGVIDNAIW
jgi:hypothetical protein